MGQKLNLSEQAQLVHKLRESTSGLTRAQRMNEALRALGFEARFPRPSASMIQRYINRADGNEVLPALPPSAYERIHAAEREIRAALLEIDAERDRLHQRLLELDNLAAKYKNLGK